MLQPNRSGSSLGDPVAAAHKVDAVLRQNGDPTTVQSQKVRPEFTAFGQTDWSLTRSGAVHLSCGVRQAQNAPIFALMGRVEPDQRWGVGTIPDSPVQGRLGAVADGRVSGSADGRTCRSERHDRRRPGRTTRVGNVRGRRRRPHRDGQLAGRPHRGAARRRMRAMSACVAHSPQVDARALPSGAGDPVVARVLLALHEEVRAVA